MSRGFNNFGKKKSNVSMYVVVFLAVVASVVFLSEDLDKYTDTTSPVILLKDKVVYIGNSSKIYFSLYDNKKLSSYDVKISDGVKTIDIKNEKVFNENNINVQITLPKLDLFFDKKNSFLILSVFDDSYWNFGLGNKSTKKVKIVFDNKRPVVNIINASKSISRGGSALVVFEATDENIDTSSIYIQTNFGKIFAPVEFVREGFYASLIAWPVYEGNFLAYIVAKDKAGNSIKRRISLYKKYKKYKTSKIKLSNKFLNGVIKSLYFDLMQSTSNAKVSNNETMLDKFKYLNEDQRQKDEILISKHTTDVSPMDPNSFNISVFHPLARAAVVGNFGSFRIFTKNKNKISTSYHLGLDVASVKRADIVSSNDAKVVFIGNNGLYGNMIILDHSFGLYTLYGHTSRVLVYEGDSILANKVIARTGQTGLALGDHLHFGVLVQGVEVRPQEWMDKIWIKNHITTIMSEAKNHIIQISL